MMCCTISRVVRVWSVGLKSSDDSGRFFTSATTPSRVYAHAVSISSSIDMGLALMAASVHTSPIGSHLQHGNEPTQSITYDGQGTPRADGVQRQKDSRGRRCPVLSTPPGRRLRERRARSRGRGHDV